MTKGYTSQEEKNKDAWIFAASKAGFPQAAHINATGGVDELHEARKTMRRAMNAVHAGIGPVPSDTETSAIYHAGAVISRISAMIDTLDMKSEKQSNSTFGGVKVLHNRTDFENHYKVANADAEDREMNLADLLRGIAGMRTTTAVSNALSVGTDSTGGYAVPSVLMPGIMGAMVPLSSLLTAGAGVVMLEEGAKNYTFAAVDTIPTAAWRAEAGNVAASDPAFRAVVATPRSLAFTFKVSRELLADGRGLVEALYQAIAQAFAKELDRAGLRGSGTAPEIRGLLNTSGIQAVTNGANGASQATTKFANLFTGVQSLLAADAPLPTAAIMAPRSLIGFAGLADTTGQPMRVPAMLEPVRMLATSQVPVNLTVGTSNDCTEIYLGDFSQCFYAMRESVSVQLLRELYAGTGEVGFMCHVRADFVVRYPAAFAVVTGMRA